MRAPYGQDKTGRRLKFIAMELGAAAHMGHGRRQRGAGREVAGLGRLRRVALVAALVALIPAAFSYLGTINGPSNSSVGIRTVEWLRDHGAAGLVAQVESVYYSLTAPSKGGPTLHALPRIGYGTTGAGRTGAGQQNALAEYRPSRVTPVLQPALPGEGVWHATRPGLESAPPVLVTTYRDQPEYPRVLAGLAWINTKRTRVSLTPGRLEPAVSIPRGSMDVPAAQRTGLLATFNSGFKLSDSRGGFVLNGRTYAKMQDGQGTLVGYNDGHVDVVNWGYGSAAPASVSFARQNLPLIVNEGRPNTNLENGEWGATVGNAILVWRSGVGVDSHGNLIFAAGEEQSAESLARALVHAGAVRAMELDINSYWVSFITYGSSGAEGAKNLLPSMSRSSGRYLEPDDRDFFAVYSR
ncbi:MAG: phosphodiester glycosidase family protein [Solirubrobacterales bacterium]|nr:phosphodiester glycosidase family protein [Solirubrobacterales bacterium]